MADSTLIDWARGEAARLQQLANTSIPPDPVETTARARQFLSDHAPGTTFEEMAGNAFSTYPGNAGPILTVVCALEEWATYEESGISKQKPFDVQFRIEAATDIMEQVQFLLSDRAVHLAAPIVLAGAALEEFLRSMQVDSGQPIVGKPGISAYAEALRKVELVSRNDAKDITAWAGLRNDAAHGHFDDLSRERTLIMVEAINLFISRHTEAN